MRKTLLVARHEFWRYITRRGFLFAVLGLPLIMAAIFGVTILIVSGQADDPVGYVDEAAILLPPRGLDLPGVEAEFVPYPDAAAAAAALEGEAVQAYFVVPADYLASGEIALFHRGDPFDGIYSDIDTYLRASLVADMNVQPDVADLLVAGDLDYDFVSLGSGEEGENDVGAFFFPFIIGTLLVIAVFTTAGYMLQAVVDEKENRTMEILVTSLRPEQLMAGKIIGLVALGMVQVAVWVAFALVGYGLLVSNNPDFAILTPPAELIAVAVIWFIPYYVLYAALVAAIGVSVTEVSEGQQAVGVLSLLSALPFWFLVVFISAPEGPISVLLSLLPFSSPLAILIRWSLTTIPLWQLLLSWLILVGSAAFAVYLVGRVLRVGMLRYGQRLSLRQMLGTLRRSEVRP